MISLNESWHFIEALLYYLVLTSVQKYILHEKVFVDSFEIVRTHAKILLICFPFFSEEVLYDVLFMCEAESSL